LGEDVFDFHSLGLFDHFIEIDKLALEPSRQGPPYGALADGHETGNSDGLR
jgi:hypothetical protein